MYDKIHYKLKKQTNKQTNNNNKKKIQVFFLALFLSLSFKKFFFLCLDKKYRASLGTLSVLIWYAFPAFCCLWVQSGRYLRKKKLTSDSVALCVLVSFTSPHMHAESLQLCPTLCDPMDCRLPSCSVQGVSRQEYYSGLPWPPPGDLPDQRSNLHWQVGSLPLAPWEPLY